MIIEVILPLLVLVSLIWMVADIASDISGIMAQTPQEPPKRANLQHRPAPIDGDIKHDL